LVSAARHVINVARHAGMEVSAVMATARHGDAGTMTADMAETVLAMTARHQRACSWLYTNARRGHNDDSDNDGGHDDGGNGHRKNDKA
jgi:hypothetical protein